MMKLLCKLGIHRPLFGHDYAFTDTVSHKMVYYATCPCGKIWMTNSLNKYIGFKVKASV